jgi:hypothetical protein
MCGAIGSGSHKVRRIATGCADPSHSHTSPGPVEVTRSCSLICVICGEYALKRLQPALTFHALNQLICRK